MNNHNILTGKGSEFPNVNLFELFFGWSHIQTILFVYIRIEELHACAWWAWSNRISSSVCMSGSAEVELKQIYVENSLPLAVTFGEAFDCCEVLNWRKLCHFGRPFHFYWENEKQIRKTKSKYLCDKSILRAKLKFLFWTLAFLQKYLKFAICSVVAIISEAYRDVIYVLPPAVWFLTIFQTSHFPSNMTSYLK